MAFSVVKSGYKMVRKKKVRKKSRAKKEVKNG